MTVERTEVVVLGAGPGGYAAAFMAADLGKRVVLIDANPELGGVCLNRGCIPSKALLHAADVLFEARHADVMGIAFPPPTIDIEKLRTWKEGIVSKLTGGLTQLAKGRKVDVRQGRGRFLEINTLEITAPDGSTSRLEFEHCIIATGSRPVALPTAEALSSERVWHSTRALELKDVPERLLVVGGGAIGLELGQAYAALGSQVTVVEAAPQIVPGTDTDLVRVLARALKPHFAAIRTDCRLVGVRETAEGLHVRLEGKDAPAEEERFDAMLVAIGRKPNSAGLGLEEIGVRVNKQGFIEVDSQRRTSQPHIFAIGDVTGNPMLAHKASFEGKVAAEVIAGHGAVYDPQAIPAVVYTHPEMAVAGLTETQAKEQGREVRIGRFPWAASGRALASGNEEGITKLIVDAETNRILGLALIGRGAGDMIAEGVLAIEMGATAEDLKLSIHPHPTLSETVMEAAEAIFGVSTHVLARRR